MREICVKRMFVLIESESPGRTTTMPTFFSLLPTLISVIRVQHARTCHSVAAILSLSSLTAFFLASLPSVCLVSDAKLKFSIEPKSTDSSYNQWVDAMRMVVRLPGGIPPEFRKKVSVCRASPCPCPIQLSDLSSAIQKKGKCEPDQAKTKSRTSP